MPMDNVETHIPLSCPNLDGELPGVSCGHPCKPDWDWNTELCCEEILRSTSAPSRVNTKPRNLLGNICTGPFLGRDLDFFCYQIPRGLNLNNETLKSCLLCPHSFRLRYWLLFWLMTIYRKRNALTQIDGVILNVHIYNRNLLQPSKTELGLLCFVSLLRSNLIRCRNIRVCGRRLNRVFDAAKCSSSVQYIFQRHGKGEVKLYLICCLVFRILPHV